MSKGRNSNMTKNVKENPKIIELGQEKCGRRKLNGNPKMDPKVTVDENVAKNKKSVKRKIDFQNAP